ncbi:hypothetical protein Ccrd_013983 [Cynara cardunculus var. scolymus]|uniref:Protein MULTIPLE CHLOROPLAST DIVISION SITE 1 n=1 Tax=Cynara cardunculus var. scolymus TaxID=59895 RepID=A0A103YEL8_CYNCS|nr:hypothetical protein Ccrd_013983 [Cynara cardunculus var. scolymus]
MASVWPLQLHPISIPHQVSTNALDLKPQLGFKERYRIWNRKNKYRDFFVRASGDALPSGEVNPIKDEAILEKTENNGMVVLRHQVSRLQETIISLPPIVFLVRYKRSGSVADLVRRGQLNSDRRGISKTPLYDDPFDNPLVKISKNNLSVEMCGKVYRLAPVTLTREEQNIHQKRRSRAYQWKRPTIFLKEGDPIPSDVDPDTVRWIPANHPFATTASDITEDLAQNNVRQKHGVPFRIQAEHEALQKKLEALQSDQKFNNLGVDPGTARNFERPFKSNLKLDDQQAEQNSVNGQTGSQPESQTNSHTSSSNSTSEEKRTQ